MSTDTIGLMNEAFFVSKKTILEWINSFFSLSVQKIEHLGDGVVYCHILDCLYPGVLTLSKLNFNARTEVDNIKNLKFLQAALKNCGLQREFDLQRIASCNYMENLALIQYFKCLFDTNYNGQPYDAVERRRSASRALPPAPQRRSSSNPSHVKEEKLQVDNSGELQRELAELQAKYGLLEKERNFYFKKLLLIEQALQEGESDVNIDSLKQILYATDISPK
ncbi:hypothetical protein RCL1_006765 [Eukaryota sp. TZLM3-RCL]